MAQIVQVKAGQDEVRLPDRVTHTATDKVLLTDAQFDSLNSGAFTSVLTDLGPGIMAAVVDLTDADADAKTIATFTPGFAGVIRSVVAIVSTAATTSGKSATVGVFVDGTEINGGRIALTSANATPVGTVLGATNVTFSSANPNNFSSTDSITIKTVAAPTTFAEGTVAFVVFLEPTVAKNTFVID